MLREVACAVRRIQQANIIAQSLPDGTAWELRRVTARSKKERIGWGDVREAKNGKLF